jgi:alkylated DNA repair dioxygenase AlkB
MSSQLKLFKESAALPDGFRYQPELLTDGEEAALLAKLPPLPFKEFEFHGFLGKRRVVSFGWRYDFSQAKLMHAEPLPEFLLPLRDKAAQFARLSAENLAHALVTEYTPGAAIGWHKDRRDFGDVIGISLASPTTFRFRRKTGRTWQRASLTLEPRSAYLMHGASRSEWEHSIPPVDALRYSITFRSLRVLSA